MPDYFALFNETRRPWLEPEWLKEKFHRFSSDHHPDMARGSDLDFSALNIAYQTLRDPKTRLRHLIDLEFPGIVLQNQQLPEPIMKLFLETGKRRQALDNFLSKNSHATTRLAQALLASEKDVLREDLEDWLAVLAQKEGESLNELKLMDKDWPDHKPAGEYLAVIYQNLSHLSNWSAQLREGLLKLSF